MKEVKNIIFHLLIFAAGFGLSGCGMKLINQTPDVIPQNPSSIYTLTLQVKPEVSAEIIRESVAAAVVINGRAYAMKRVAPDLLQFATDVELPLEQAQALYYYEITYEQKTVSGLKEKTKKSNLYRFNLANRYIVQLESDRAPVGSTIPVMGRGFTPSDTIVVGEQAAETRFVSENVLQFIVPPLQAGVSYPVTWESGLGAQVIGNFRVDPSTLIVRPERLVIRSGDRAVLVIQIEFEAPPGGLIVNDTTDVPRSIVMPEVVIPEGSRTVNITVEGAEPGSGNLYFNVGGMNEVAVPVTVTTM